MCFAVASAAASHGGDHVRGGGAAKLDSQRMLCIAEAAARRYEDAIVACTLALEIEPERAEVYSNRGVAWLMLGEAARAVGDFSAAIDRSPGNPLHYFNRALAEEQLLQWRTALTDYDAAIERAPGMAIAFNNRGFVHERIGERALAVADYATAVAIDPQLRVAIRNLGRLKP